MSKEKNVIDYYVLCNKLKDVIRTGWKDWKVKRERVESVAEHIYGVQMLAIAINSEYEYDIDIFKVIYMLAIHELGEAIIGDINPFQMNREEKEKIEHKAIHEILSSLIDGDKIESILLEFDAHETEESKFAYQCDKLECCIQCKLYDQEGCVDLTHQEGNNTVNDKNVQELLKTGKPWSDLWITYWENKCPYDKNFMAISNYVKDNNIDKD